MMRYCTARVGDKIWWHDKDICKDVCHYCCGSSIFYGIISAMEAVANPPHEVILIQPSL